MSLVAPPSAAAVDVPEGAREALRAALAASVARAATRPQATLAAAIAPIAPLDPIRLYAAAEAARLERWLWLQPSHGFGLVGLGAAWSTRATGSHRFDTVRRAWSELVGAAIVADGPHARGCGPLLVGGFGFADAPATSPLWQGFDVAHLTLPQWLLTVTPAGSWLTVSSLVAPGDAAGEVSESLLRAWDGLLEDCAVGSVPPAGRETLRLVGLQPDAAGWRDSVSRLSGAVGRGRLDKVVLTRQVELTATRPIDVPLVLRRLERGSATTTVFAVGRAERTFLGATPERLVSLRGREFRSVAMAGTARRAADRPTDTLLASEMLASDKEREEHAVVVAMLRETLGPETDRLELPDGPRVVQLRHVQHLVTPVRGRLRQPVSVLRLVELLHPTPAVGGAPRELALELIGEEERHERGWYAGPVGWVDRHGDGDFVVAIRSGLVESGRATLLAGCGIVADSDPEREWQESSAKLLALGSALGRVEA